MDQIQFAILLMAVLVVSFLLLWLGHKAERSVGRFVRTIKKHRHG